MSRLICAAFVLLANLAGAQTYPSRPISLVVPFSTGGPADAHMRQFSAALGKMFQQSIIVSETALDIKCR